MDTNNIWGQYWIILLSIGVLVIECIRDERIDKLISRIPKDKWDKRSRCYKYYLILYGRSQLRTNKKWFTIIIIGLYIITGALGYIGFQSIANIVGASMFIVTTIIIILNSKEELEESKFKFGKKEIVFLVLFSLLTFAYKIGHPFNIEILDAVRVFGVWFTYWLLFRYIPLKACDAMTWLIEFSKRFALKEADKEDGLGNFLKFIIVIIAGACIGNLDKAIDIKKLVLDVCYNWFFFLVVG